MQAHPKLLAQHAAESSENTGAVRARGGGNGSKRSMRRSKRRCRPKLGRQTYISTLDYDCLRYLNNIDVQVGPELERLLGMVRGGAGEGH